IRDFHVTGVQTCALPISRFPLEAQRAEAEAKRRIGLGVTGLADALILCNRRYGSAEAVALTRRWMERLRDAAYQASCALAAEKRSEERRVGKESVARWTE